MHLGIAERYRSIVDDWPAFAASIERPLPTSFWSQSLRIAPERLLARLADSGLHPEPSAWARDVYRLPADSPELGRSVEWLAGLLQIQEEVASLPVLLLDPQAGERILDLCAAPGNKTAQAAIAMGDAGTVIANDIADRRLGILHRTVDRLGLTSVVTTAYDGASLPRSVGLFDGVLADVPCSCEGTCRKHPDVLRKALRQTPGWRSGAQKALLRKAILVCRPGGRIVYSTCTFAPEENEGVLDEILAERDDVEIESVDVPGLIAAPGLSHFGERTFDPRAGEALRIWPHPNDTGGFFVALLRKRADADERWVPPDGPNGEVTELFFDEVLAPLARRFGLPPDLFDDHRAVRLRGPKAFLLRRAVRVPSDPGPIKAGLPLLRLDAAVPAPTSAGARWLAPRASRSVVDLEDAEVEPFAAGDVLEVPRERRPEDREGDLVLVRHRGVGLGKAVLDGERLHPRVPKAWRRTLRQIRARRAAERGADQPFDNSANRRG